VVVRVTGYDLSLPPFETGARISTSDLLLVSNMHRTKRCVYYYLFLRLFLCSKSRARHCIIDMYIAFLALGDGGVHLEGGETKTSFAYSKPFFLSPFCFFGYLLFSPFLHPS